MGGGGEGEGEGAHDSTGLIIILNEQRLRILFFSRILGGSEKAKRKLRKVISRMGVDTRARERRAEFLLRPSSIALNRQFVSDTSQVGGARCQLGESFASLNRRRVVQMRTGKPLDWIRTDFENHFESARVQFHAFRRLS